jgi:hypothetical protein
LNGKDDVDVELDKEVTDVSSARKIQSIHEDDPPALFLLPLAFIASRLESSADFIALNVSEEDRDETRTQMIAC